MHTITRTISVKQIDNTRKFDVRNAGSALIKFCCFQAIGYSMALISTSFHYMIDLIVLTCTEVKVEHGGYTKVMNTVTAQEVHK